MSTAPHQRPTRGAASPRLASGPLPSVSLAGHRGQDRRAQAGRPSSLWAASPASYVAAPATGPGCAESANPYVSLARALLHQLTTTKEESNDEMDRARLPPRVHRGGDPQHRRGAGLDGEDRVK